MRRLEQLITKSSQRKLSMIQVDKVLRFLLCHQEMLVNMNFNWQRCFTGKSSARKSCCFKKISTFSVRQRIKSTNWHCKETVSKIRQNLWIWETINKKPLFENYSKLDLIYNINYSFYKYYRNNKKFNNYSLKWKYSILAEIFNDLDQFNKLTRRKEKQTRKKQMCMTRLQNYIMIC